MKCPAMAGTVDAMKNKSRVTKPFVKLRISKIQLLLAPSKQDGNVSLEEELLVFLLN